MPYEVEYLPASLAEIVLPMNQGIIDKLQKMHRKRFLQRILAEQYKKKIAISTKKNNLKSCAYMLVDARDSVLDKNLNNLVTKTMAERK